MLIPEVSLPLEYYLIPFLIIVGICLILIVIFMVGIIFSHYVILGFLYTYEHIFYC